MESLSRVEITCEHSDHLSLWVRLDTDTDLEKIDQILAAKSPGSLKRETTSCLDWRIPDRSIGKSSLFSSNRVREVVIATKMPLIEDAIGF